MVPRKSDEYIKPTAEEEKVSEDLVDAVKTFYWKEVRKSITDMKYHAVFVENLGTFKAKSWKLQDLLTKYTNYINCADTKTFNRMALRMEVENRITRIKDLLSLIDQEGAKKQSVKEKRYGKDTEGSMGE